MVELPWHNLRDQLDRIIPKLFPTEKDRSPSPLPSAMLDFSKSDSIFELVTHARHNDFVSDKIASVLNVSGLATRQETLTAAMAMMAPYMPEKYEKETMDSVNQLIDPTSSKRMQVLVSFMALLLANNVLPSEALGAFVIFLDEVAGNQAFDMLPLREEPSTQAIISKLLFAAVQMDVPRLLQSAVKNNVNINRQSIGWEPTTLLLEAVKLERLRIIQLLINAAADLLPIRLDDALRHDCKCPFGRKRVKASASEFYGVARFYCPCEAFWFSEREVCSRAASTRIANEVLPLLLQSSGTVGPGPVTTLAIRYRATSETLEKVIQGGGSVDECCIPVLRPFHDFWPSESRDVCTQNSTPLSAAATSGDAELVRLLLEYGADPNGPVAGYTSDFLVDWGEYFYKSPLLVATEHNNLEIVQLLLKHDADPNLCPLDALESAEKEQLIRGFHNKNLYEDDMDDDDTVSQILVLYPLQAAAGLADNHIAEVLLGCGANVNPVHGTPPLAIAACHGRYETVGLLLSKGAMINPSHVQDFGMSPLEGAVLSGDETMVEWILLAGANPNGSSAGRGGGTPLQRAVLSGDETMVEWILLAGANPNGSSAGRGGGTPLQRAAESADTAIFDSLLKAGANLDSSLGPNPGATILYWSVIHGNHDRVKWLLCNGVNPNGDPKDRKSPLTAAILVEDLNLVSLLIKWGADTNDPYPMRKVLSKGEQLSFLQNWTKENAEISLGLMPPLQWAVTTGQLGVVACLCSSGADVNGTNTPPDRRSRTLGLTALHLAVARRSKDIVTYLLARGADIDCIVDFDCEEYTPLCISVCNSDQEMTELLLRNGADPYVPIAATERSRRFSILPLEHACGNRDDQMVRLLLSSGVDVNVGHPLVYTFDIPPLYWSDYDEPKLSNQIVNTMELLVSYGAKVNQRFVRSPTPLQAVIRRAEYALHCARRLIELGAEINAPPSSAPFGRTALQASVLVGNVEFVQFLLKEGAEVNAPAALRSGVTALQAAAMMGYLRIAQILLEHGADIDADPSPVGGWTAIDGAALWGRIDMVKLLLDNYNGPRSISDVCASAMEYAKEFNQWYLMEFLEKYERPTR
jgi:ankyrin repeat protein